ncbi:RidA family protein [Agreia sp. VKM Ac-1783]|uniref:RidA family protein n=1 Tax=Agreia sp. VKM Ac-1783 TaxID=1938889 RepID=UPI000A2AA643|nr:RidA family protein [Agreia sp. VKM Ac-1783]SMQ71014.1 Enamine deaminase RidA, house cleaning of reactive enamine intermediates, YjgF/YER057c/UK114 family [Agreia sp. VKM Ac-1783]
MSDPAAPSATKVARTASDPTGSAAAPDAPRPAGAYAVARAVGDLVHTAGMTPRRDGTLVARGTLGDTIDDDSGRELAALATERALDAATSILGPGEHLVEVVSLTVFIAATSSYERHSSIADAASAVIVDRMPGAPLPVRAAVGVASLPGGAPVEVQLIARFA